MAISLSNILIMSANCNAYVIICKNDLNHEKSWCCTILMAGCAHTNSINMWFTWNFQLISSTSIMLSDCLFHVKLRFLLNQKNNFNLCYILHSAGSACIYSYSRAHLAQMFNWFKRLPSSKFHLHKSKTHFYTHPGVTNSFGGSDWEVAIHHVSTILWKLEIYARMQGR